MDGASENNPVNDLLKEEEHLKASRTNWEAHWQQLGDLMLPRRNDFQTTHSRGTERRNKIFDSTPCRAVSRFASGLHNIMTPSAVPWFILKPRFRPLEQNRQIQLWLEEVQKQVVDTLSRPQVNFHPTAYEYYTDLGTFGTAVMYIEDVPGEGPLFRHFGLNDCLLASNKNGFIDTCFRNYKQTAKDLFESYPVERLPESVLQNLENGKIYEEYDMIHVVKPYHSVKPGPLLEIQAPFVSLTICKKERMLMDINGFEDFPYVSSRWNRNPLEIYGRGPGVDALPDIRMLNEMEKTFLKSVQKAVSPPLMVPDDGFLAPLRTTPDAVNYYRAGLGGRELVFQMPTVGRIEYAEAKMGMTRQSIEKTFFLDLLELPGPMAPDGDVMRFSATEIAMRQRDRMTVIGPIVARQEVEFLSPMLNRTMKVMARNGMLPPVPEEFAEEPIKIEYVNPVSVSQRSVEMNAVSQLIQFIMPLAQIDPNVIKRLNPQRITTMGVDILRAPPSVVYTEEEAQEIARQEQEQMAREEAMAQEMASADIVAQRAKATKDMAEAQNATEKTG